MFTSMFDARLDSINLFFNSVIFSINFSISYSSSLSFEDSVGNLWIVFSCSYKIHILNNDWHIVQHAKLYTFSLDTVAKSC